MPVFALIGGIGVPELLLVLVIVLILFGAGRLPQVLESFGKGIKSFRDAQRDEDDGKGPPRQLSETPVSDAQEVKDKDKAKG